MDQQKSAWQSVPGLLQLIEEGAEPRDLAHREFTAAQIRGGGLVSSGMSPSQIGGLERLWLWLCGFRRKEVLCERLPIWVPIAQLWSAPGGQLTFTYESSTEAEASAEITVCSLVGFGGAGRLKLTSSVTLKTQGKGLAYVTRAHLTIYRYRHCDSGESMDRVDVDCSGDYGEFDSQELSPEAHPFGLGPATLPEIEGRGLVVTRIERRSNSAADTMIKLGRERLRSWKFKLTPNLPLLEVPLGLAASCQRAQSFSTEFSLPSGQDYAFCVPKGESPVVPVCVALA